MSFLKSTGLFLLWLVISLFIFIPSLEAQISTTTTPDVSRCVPGAVQLITTPSGGTSYTYSWSPATGLSNAAISNPVATPLTTTTYVVTVTDVPTSNTVKDTVTITIQNIPPPLAIFPQADTICQGSSLSLDVRNSNSCQVVTGTCQTAASFITAGSGVNLAFSNIDNPLYKENNFFTSVRSTKHQYVFTAKELNGYGITGPTTINAISWDFTAFTSITYNNLTFKMGCTNDSVLTTTFKTGLTTVYNPKTKTFNSTQWELFSFDQPFVWDGKSNIVLEICFANPSASTGMPWVRYDIYTNNVANYASANANVCGNTSAALTNRRPNTRFHHCNVVNPTTLTYAWTPTTGLSNAAIRNPVATPSATTSYILTATDNNGCSVKDTVIVSVAPQYNLSVNSDTVLCQADTVDLIALHNSGPGATFNWSTSSWIQNSAASPTKAYFNSNAKVYAEVTSAAGCTKMDSFSVNLVTPVTADILSPDTTICAGDSLPMKVSTNSMSCATYSNVSCASPANFVFPNLNTFASGGVTVSPFDANGTSTPAGQKKQYLILASELASLVSTNTISKLGFNLQSTGTATTARTGFTIKMGCTNVTSFPFGASNFITGTQTVFTPKTINIGSGWNDFIFDNAFVWDGVSNVVVEICWQNSASLGFSFSLLNYSITSFTSVLVNFSSTNYCAETAGSFATTIRPDMRFGHCASPPNPGYKFVWTPSTGVSDDTIPEPKIAASISAYYYLNVTDPLSGCADKDSVLINVAPNFTTSISNDTTLCSPDSVQLNVSHNAAQPITYNWSPASELSDTSISNPWVYVNDQKRIVSEIRSSLGCIKWDTVNLGLYDQIDLSIIAPSGVSCEGDSIQLDATHTLACGPSSSVLCSTSNTLTLGSGTVTTSLFNTTPFVGSDKSSKKQYIIRKTELNSGGVTGSAQLSSVSFEITALGKIDYQNFTIKMGCTSLSYFNGTFASGLVTVFDPKDVNLVLGTNTFVFDRRFNWDGQSNVVVQICYNNAATGSNSEIYYALPSPLYNCTQYARGNSVCNNSTGTAYNRRPNMKFQYCVVPTSSYSYNWLPSNLYSDPGLINPMAMLVSPGVYTLELIDLNSNCVTKDSVTLDILTFDLKAKTDTTLCSTQDFQLEAITDAAQPKYSWSPAIQLSNDTIANPLITVDNGTVFIVEVTDSAGCIKSDTVDIILLPRPTANASPKTITVCRNEEVQLQGSGGGNYEWKPAQGLSNPLVSSPVANVSKNTKYYLVVTNAFGCTDEDSVMINVHPSPKLDLGPDTSYCTGGYFILDAGGDFLTYYWQDKSTDTSIKVTSDGIYWLRVTDAFNCEFTDTVDITLAPAPKANIDYLTDICIGDSAILDAQNSGSAILWSTGETSQTIVVKDAGFYWVEIDDGQCIGKDSTIVVLYEYPVSDLAENINYCEKEYPFGMTITAGGDEYRYKWDNGQVTNSIVVTSEGIYTVVITNGGKCSIEKSATVKQVCREVIFVPNTFTPNNDWTNDVFTISAQNMDEFEFRIFNRWGEVIYFTKNPQFQWTGEFNGEALPEGVYPWRLDYKMKLSDGSLDSREEHGTINLLR